MQIRKIGKKAKLLTDEPIGLIIAVAAIVIISLLIYKLLFSPSPDEETQKSFLSSLKKTVEEIPSGQIREFQLWGNDKIYLVYFGDRKLVEANRDLYLRIFGTFDFKVPWGKGDYKILFRAKHNYNRATCFCLLDPDKFVKGYGDNKYRDARCNYCFNFPGEIIKVEFKNSNLSTGMLDFANRPLVVSPGDKIYFLKNNQNQFYVTLFEGGRVV